MQSIVTQSQDVKSYTAGLFDGEGSVIGYHVKSHQAPHLRVMIANTYLPVLDWLQERWGGKIYIHKRRPDQNKSGAAWLLHGKVAGSFLKDIRPFLKIKHRHADVGIELSEICGTKGRNHGLDIDQRWERSLLGRLIHSLNGVRRPMRRPFMLPANVQPMSKHP